METFSVRSNAQFLQEEIIRLQVSLREFRMNTDMARAEMVAMENSVSLQTQDTPKLVMPQIKELSDDLAKGIFEQNNQNEFLQKQVTGLKKEQSVLRQNIVASNTRASLLEEAVG